MLIEQHIHVIDGMTMTTRQSHQLLHRGDLANGQLQMQLFGDQRAETLHTIQANQQIQAGVKQGASDANARREKSSSPAEGNEAASPVRCEPSRWMRQELEDRQADADQRGMKEHAL